jgi:hypothetical protein
LNPKSDCLFGQGDQWLALRGFHRFGPSKNKWFKYTLHDVQGADVFFGFKGHSDERLPEGEIPEGEPLVPLPKKTVTIEEVELPKQEREIYDYIFTRAKRTYNDNVVAGTLLQSYSTIFAQILRLRQALAFSAVNWLINS